MTNLAFNQSGSGLQHLEDQATVSQCVVMGKPIEVNTINVYEALCKGIENEHVENTNLLAAQNDESFSVVQSPSYVTQRQDATVDYLYDQERNETIGQHSPSPSIS